MQVEHPYISNGVSRDCEVRVPVWIRLRGMQPFTRFETHGREETDFFRNLLARDVNGQDILVRQKAQFHAVRVVPDRYLQHFSNTFAPCPTPPCWRGHLFRKNPHRAQHGSWPVFLAKVECPTPGIFKHLSPVEGRAFRDCDVRPRSNTVVPHTVLDFGFEFWVACQDSILELFTAPSEQRQVFLATTVAMDDMGAHMLGRRRIQGIRFQGHDEGGIRTGLAGTRRFRISSRGLYRRANEPHHLCAIRTRAEVLIGFLLVRRRQRSPIGVAHDQAFDRFAGMGSQFHTDGLMYPARSTLKCFFTICKTFLVSSFRKWYASSTVVWRHFAIAASG